MTSAPSQLSLRRWPVAGAGRGVAALCIAAAVTFFVTGSGMLEGHAVYPSWRTLADFPGFADYHAEYGRLLIPFLPVPLVLATIGNAWLVFRPPAGVPRGLPIATLVAQVVILVLTVTMFLPIQAELATPGNSPAEIVALVDRLIGISPIREIPGLAVAAAFVVMLYLAIRGRAR